jgi:hypothetical protein
MSTFRNLWNTFSGKSRSQQEREREWREQRQKEEDRLIRAKEEEMARHAKAQVQREARRTLVEVQAIVGKGTAMPVAAPHTARFTRKSV